MNVPRPQGRDRWGSPSARRSTASELWPIVPTRGGQCVRVRQPVTGEPPATAATGENARAPRRRTRTPTRPATRRT